MTDLCQVVVHSSCSLQPVSLILVFIFYDMVEEFIQNNGSHLDREIRSIIMTVEPDRILPLY